MEKHLVPLGYEPSPTQKSRISQPGWMSCILFVGSIGLVYATVDPSLKPTFAIICVLIFEVVIMPAVGLLMGIIALESSCRRSIPGWIGVVLNGAMLLVLLFVTAKELS